MQYPGKVGPIQNDAAPFSVEMAQGSMPTVARVPVPQRLPWTFSTPEVVNFPVESTYGWHPDQPRLFTAPRIPLPSSQTTHVPAAFSVEMTQGARPADLNHYLGHNAGWISTQTTPTAATFSVEMTQGQQPSAHRERLYSHQGLQVWISDLISLSPDMTQGMHPDLPRLRVMPRWPVHPSQTTQTSAPFSIEMAQGSQPSQPRPPVTGKLGWVWSPVVETIIANFRPQVFALLAAISNLFSRSASRRDQASVAAGSSTATSLRASPSTTFSPSASTSTSFTLKSEE